MLQVSSGKGEIRGAMKDNAISFYYHCGAMASEPSYIPAHSWLRLWCPNLPPAIEADPIPPNVGKGALSARARHLMSPSFSIPWCSSVCAMGQSKPQGRAGILFAKRLTGR